MLYLTKDEILHTNGSKTMRNKLSTVRIRQPDEKKKEVKMTTLISQRDLMKSVPPKQIAADFHRKSHFKALETVYLKQGDAIIKTSPSKGETKDDAEMLEKLVTAVSKNKNLLSQSSYSPMPGSTVTFGNKISSIGQITTL